MTGRLFRRLFGVPAAAVVGVVCGVVTPVWAHHSFVAQFDPEKPVALVGTVATIEWKNPHAFIYIDVKDEKGTVTKWALELGSPNGLIRAGWKRDAVKVGDQVRVNGYLARDGSKLANARTFTFADGRSVITSTAGDGGPQK